jgi:hypothetical protein
MQKTINPAQKSKTPTKCFENVLGQKSKMFEIMYVRHDEDQSLEVVESATIDFNAVIENLAEGNSVFIAPKIQESYSAKKKTQNHNYFNHI